MTDERATPTHSASWHYEQAEALLSKASHTSMPIGPEDLRATHLINPKVQEHYVAMAQAHATLALAGATILAADPHSRARTELADHARGAGVRDA